MKRSTFPRPKAQAPTMTSKAQAPARSSPYEAALNTSDDEEDTNLSFFHHAALQVPSMDSKRAATREMSKKRCRDTSRTKDSKRQRILRECNALVTPVESVRDVLSSRRVQFTTMTIFSFPTDLGACAMAKTEGVALGMTMKHCKEETIEVPTSTNNIRGFPSKIHRSERLLRLRRAGVDEKETRAYNLDTRRVRHFRMVAKYEYAEEKERIACQRRRESASTMR
ncbi:hypothetical protein AeRB84_012170 [Aphanomyces euteiches]|nr:hypothetical protein AeRB84_012170 [Aphanomyces euteiches]